MEEESLLVYSTPKSPNLSSAEVDPDFQKLAQIIGQLTIETC